MGFLIALLTVVLVLDSVFLIFLVLLQLPKKEAGAGLAFGGGATEALFGAGSGTVLTKATKYAAGIFMGLALVLSALNAYRHSQRGLSFEEQLSRSAAESAPALTAGTNAASAPVSIPVGEPVAAPVVEPAAAPNVLLSSTNPPADSPPAKPAE